ncbi:MAG: ImmA/IrrE family metallo-endopeptidase [Pseudolabrys sp.]|nr:ImmA/IrrE family metallo-endopeptidase [Pseudolabrys sp.]
MMAGPDKAKAVRTAREVLSEARIAAAPVPVERVAKSRGVKVQFSPLDQELSGMAFIRDGVPLIAVNSLHHPNRQRFTMAHELAHHVMHAELLAGSVHVDKVILRRDVLAGAGVDAHEIEANNFAAELLMPEEWLGPYAANLDVGDDEALATVARKFKVSVAALQFRLLKM